MTIIEHILRFAHIYGKLESGLMLQTRPEVLTPLQYRLFLLLSEGVPKTPGQIADCLSLSLPNTSRELRQLQALGLIQRSQDPEDKRSHIITLTEAGGALLENLFGALTTHMDGIFKDLSPAEIEKMKRAFDDLSDVLGKV